MKNLLIALIGFVTFAHADITIKEGTDYTVITPPAKSVSVKPGKVNVTEFFSYACIHCSILEPTLDQWLATTKNVDFNRVQVVWENNFRGYAKLSATAQSMNLGTNFSQKVFDAVMNQHQNLEDPTQLQSFLKANKAIVDPSKFMATYNSFAISGKPQEYAQYTQGYNITGTPTFVIANKYMTKPAQPAQLIQVIQALVNKAKKEQKVK